MKSKLAGGLLAMGFVALTVEAGLRLFVPALALPQDERLAYQHDVVLGWRPEPGSQRSVSGSRQIHAAHNGRGFRDREHGEKRRPRLLFVGDSYVWGYDVEVDERFSDLLQRQWPELDVINLGVSGYGTDQEFLLLQTQLQVYEPDGVVLILSPNDSLDNTRNHVDGRYWKPYFVVENDALRLRGVPVPVSLAYRVRERPLLFSSYGLRAVIQAWARIRGEGARVAVPDPSEALLVAMADLVRSSGAEFAVGWVGVAGLPPEVRGWLEDRVGADAVSVRFPEALCRREAIPCLDLSDDRVYPSHGWHWTPEGHVGVAERIAGFLVELGWVTPVGAMGSVDAVPEFAQSLLLGFVERHPL
jgi:lysophospholipase L1-like esterase